MVSVNVLIFFCWFLGFYLVRSIIVWEIKIRAIKEGMRSFKECGNNSHFKMLLDLRKWTYYQFYPRLKNGKNKSS